MSDNDDEIDNLFGSESEGDDEQQKQPKKRLQSTASRQAEGDAAERAEKTLEDDLGQEVDAGGRGGEAYGGSEDADEPGPAKRNLGSAMEIDAPLIALPPAEQLHLLKMSNILGVEPRPFEPDTFTTEEETYIDNTGMRRVKIRDDNVMRWRTMQRPDGSEERQSNARLVRWSDGSLQLLLGDEVLDVLRQDLTSNHTYLYCMRNIIQGQAQLTSRLAFRPASLDSKLHRRLREAVDKRHGKVTKVAAHATLLNPVKAKEAQEKSAEEMIKNRETLQKRASRIMDRASAPRRMGGGGNQRLTSQYLEEDDFLDDEGVVDDEDDEGGTSTNERARKYQLSRKRDVDEDEAAQRLQSAKRAPPASGRPGAYVSKRRRDVPAQEDALHEEGSEEEEEALSTGEEEEEEADADDSVRPGSKGGSMGAGVAGRHRALQLPAAANNAAKMKARRGVVLSDDEDD